MLTFLRHQTGAAVLLSGFLATTLPLDSRAAVSSVAAGDAQAGTSDLPGVLNFPLTRALDLGYDVAVRYHTVDGSAFSGLDYLGAASVAVLPADHTVVSLGVTLAAHTANNADAAFQLHLDSAIGLGPAPSFAARSDFGMGDVSALIATDFNGDGHVDLAGAGATGVWVRHSTAAPGATTLSFSSLVSTSTGGEPASLRVADVNGDGKPDLIASTSTADHVAVVLNTTATGAAQPGLYPAFLFSVGVQPLHLDVADLNGDGLKDVVTGNSGDGTLSLLRNISTLGAIQANFATAQTLGVNAGSASPQGVAVADLDGDGRPDLAVADANADSVVVFINTTPPGNATFGFASGQSFAVGDRPTELLARDLNGDGRPDLVSSNRDGASVSVLINDAAPGAATPSFRAHVDLPCGTACNAIASGDIDGDGKPELFATNGSGDAGNLALLRNATAPAAEAAFLSLPALPSPRYFFEKAAVAADLNGDGKLDLATAGTSGFAVFLGTTPAPTAAPNFDTQFDWSIGSLPSAVSSADFNGDGKPDVVIAQTGTRSLAVRLNTTAVATTGITLGSAQGLSTLTGPTTVSVGDLNRDGLTDLVTNSLNGSKVSVFLGMTVPGATKVSFASRQDFDVGYAPEGVAIADFNSDGRDDLAVYSQAPQQVRVLLNTTSPGASSLSFSSLHSFTFGMGFTSFDAIVARDINGDGRADIVVSGDGIGVLVNTTATGAAAPSFAIPGLPLDGIGYLGAVADFNGDGRPDFALCSPLAATSAHEVRVVLNTTFPGATTATGSAAKAFATTLVYDAAATDVDGDGRIDLILSEGAGGKVGYLRNTTAPGAATPSFATEQFFGSGSTGGAIAVNDLNADGRPDVLIVNRGLGSLSILPNLQYRVAVTDDSAEGTLVHDFVFAGRFD